MRVEFPCACACSLVSDAQTCIFLGPCVCHVLHSRYDEEALEGEDEALRAGERAGQRAALLEVAREEEDENQARV